MTKYLLLIIVGIVCNLHTSALELINSGTGSVDGYLYGQLTYSGYTFRGPIDLTDEKELYVEDMADGTRYEASDWYVGDNKDIPADWDRGINAYFKPGLILPKGHEFRVVLKAGSVKSLVDGSLNDEIVTTFKVPEYLRCANIRFFGTGDNDNLSEATKLYLTFYHELLDTRFITECNPSPFYLYRNNILVYTGKCIANNEFDLSWAICNFLSDTSREIPRQDAMHFEKGVKYKVVVPPGAIQSIERPDMYNDEICFEFTGGYEGDMELRSSGNSITSLTIGEDVGTAEIYFDEEVTLLPTRFVAYMDQNPKYLHSRSFYPCFPKIEKRGNKWAAVIECPFKATDMFPTEIFIPESTFATVKGDVKVNRDIRIPLRLETSAVEEIADESVESESVRLSGSEMEYEIEGNGSITFYDLEGHILRRFAVSGKGTLDLKSMLGETVIYRLVSDSMPAKSGKLMIR